MGLGQSLIEDGAFLQFRLVDRAFAHQGSSFLAAGGAHSVDFISDPGRAANR